MMYKSMTLYTNRNIIVFNQHGNQDPVAQTAVDCYAINPRMAQDVINDTEQFNLAKWAAWSHQITKREMEYLLGLRTRARDMEEVYPR